jgi:uncharacterized protein YndB with AHSA1/START domain
MQYATSVDVGAPPDVVWSLLEDVEGWPGWTSTMTSVQRAAAGTLTEGERVRIKQPGLPAADWVVTAVDPGSAFTWRSRAAGVTTSATHEVVPAPTGSRVTLTLEQHGPLAGLMSALLGGKARRFVEIEAAGLRQRAERGE